MEPKDIRFGGGSAVTVLHPLVAVAMAIAVLLILCLRRKYVIAPLLLALFLTPKGQVLVVAGLHFNVYRIIILAGLARWAVSKRSSPLVGGFNFMDRVFTLFAVSYLIVFSLQWMEAQALIASLGLFLDAIGGYFAIRFLLRDREDIRRTIKVLAVVAIVNAILMSNEQRMGQNVLGFLGGTPIADTLRDGKIRSQGSFEVFITAGTFGATLMPLLVWLWSDAKSKMISFVGALAATVMTVTCYASTTLVSYAAGVFALCLWPMRKRMRLFRWTIVAMLVGLQLVMHGPIWSLFEHIDLTGSSSGYHRYMLIDNLIRHFGDWWLLGTRDNGSWGWEIWDTSNQYVMYAFYGGLTTFVLFIAIICTAFGRLGKARRFAEGDRNEEWFLWCLMATIFSHVIAFFGIGYFDQVQFAWFALLAVTSVAVFESKEAVMVQAEAVGEPYLGPLPKADRV